jgi:ferredoxin-like protein FixX
VISIFRGRHRLRRTSPIKTVKRKPKSEVHIRVLKEKCNGCGVCVKVCPSGSWKISDNVAEWRGMNLCLECGACFNACPAEAIVWSYPKGGEGIIYEF